MDKRIDLRYPLTHLNLRNLVMCGPLLTVIEQIACDNPDIGRQMGQAPCLHVEKMQLHHSSQQALDAVKARHKASPPVETQQLNLFESEALRQAIHGADLVIHAAGPFFKTVAPVIQNCLAERVNYLDFSDDAESVLVSYDHDADARKIGISVCIGCGAAPGLTNVMAREVAEALDTVHGIETAWVVGDEGKREMTGRDRCAYGFGRAQRGGQLPPHFPVALLPAQLEECRLIVDALQGADQVEQLFSLHRLIRDGDG